MMAYLGTVLLSHHLVVNVRVLMTSETIPPVAEAQSEGTFG
jgi:hypothetical protein